MAVFERWGVCLQQDSAHYVAAVVYVFVCVGAWSVGSVYGIKTEGEICTPPRFFAWRWSLPRLSRHGSCLVSD